MASFTTIKSEVKEIIDIDSEDDDEDIFTNGKSGSKKWTWFREGQNCIKIHEKDLNDNYQKTKSPMASVSARVDPKNMNMILKKFNSWKKLDMIEDYSDHYYSIKRSYAGPPSKNWAKRILAEWKILEKNLPDSISVRVNESRMDLMRAVIVGAKGTPYHDGLYFFDVYFPNNYPSVPPHVHYRSCGLDIAPNLATDGILAVSLLNTSHWDRGSKMMIDTWIPGISTMLQVLVSIQGLVLNAEPYFNCEFGKNNMRKNPKHMNLSLEYNEFALIASLRTMLYTIRNPPKNFEDFVVGHFVTNGREILACCKAYMDGAQVGCLSEGGVQDVDEGDKSCSWNFKINLATVIPSIVKAFLEIGIKDSQDLLAALARINFGYSSFSLNY